MLSTLLVGASIRELLPFEQLFDHPASVLLPILHEIDKNLTVVGSPSYLISKIVNVLSSCITLRRAVSTSFQEYS